MKQLILLATLLITQGAMATTCHNALGEQLLVKYMGPGIQAQLVKSNTVVEMEGEYRTRYIQELADADGNLAELIFHRRPKCLRCDPSLELKVTAQLTYLGQTHNFSCSAED